MNRYLRLLTILSLCLTSFKLLAATGMGLETINPQTVQVVYSIESDGIDQQTVASLIKQMLSESKLELGERKDAQLHLRIEEHAGQYLLYLDFSRQVHYYVGDNCYSKDGFVWGRYAKDIEDAEQLEEDIVFLFDEFIDDYLEANFSH